MNTRERFHAIMDFKPVDRLPIIEWAAWWDKTIERWTGEGLPPGDRYQIARHFNLETYYQGWLPVSRPGCPVPAAHGAPLIHSIDEYHAIKQWLYPDSVTAIAPWQQWGAEQQQGNAVIWLTLNGFFWTPRDLLGIENHLYAYYDQPELLHLICNDLLQYYRRVLSELFNICTPDFITFAEDMSYNGGPMVSENIFHEFIRPYYLQLTTWLREKGIRIIVDSDGDITQLAKWFDSCSIDGFLPLERQAGTDVAQLRANHPKFCFIGAFDKMTMNRGETAMRAEFERLLPTARQGGFIISCDHQTPPAVSLTDYQLYLKLFREYAAKI